jgi:heavy metal sensor kinase
MMAFPVRPGRLGTRLALSYVVMLVSALLLFMAGTAAIFYFQLQRQLGHYAIQDIETVEGLMSFTPDGLLRVNENYHNHPESKEVLERFLEVRSPDGMLLFRNQRLGDQVLGGAPASGEGVGGYSERQFRLRDGTAVLLVSRRHSIDGKPVVIRLGYSTEGIRHSVGELLAAGIAMLPVMLAIAGFVGYRMSRRVLDPVQQITQQAERITSNRLHERLPRNESGDELDHLAEVFNGTLARLDQSFRQLRQFTSDASHELRTPLAAIRSIGEVALQKNPAADGYREIVGSMLEEVARLTSLVDQLLMISRADAGAVTLNRSVFSLRELAREAAALLEPLLEENSQQFVLPDGGQALVEADRAVIRQAMINLLHNAIKYSAAGSKIFVSVVESPRETITFEVRDSGPGIAPEHIDRIFDRFYRLDHSRSRANGGFGLGLAIAAWAVKANGGTITVESAPGEGSTFRIELPAVPEISLQKQFRNS